MECAVVTWWATPQWREYERICGITPSRVETLAAATWQTRVVDLTQSEAHLWRGVRKSAKSLIHRAERDYAITLRPAEDMERFRRMHRTLAGRDTRPLASWDLMADWVRDGSLVLIGGAYHDRYLLNNQTVAYAAFYVWGEWAYYGHAAAYQPNVAHALVWAGLLEAKRRGATVFEVGWQGQDASAKGRGIEQFRRAFGGVDVSAFDEQCVLQG